MITPRAQRIGHHRPRNSTRRSEPQHDRALDTNTLLYTPATNTSHVSESETKSIKPEESTLTAAAKAPGAVHPRARPPRADRSRGASCPTGSPSASAGPHGDMSATERKAQRQAQTYPYPRRIRTDRARALPLHAARVLSCAWRALSDGGCANAAIHGVRTSTSPWSLRVWLCASCKDDMMGNMC